MANGDIDRQRFAQIKPEETSLTTRLIHETEYQRLRLIEDAAKEYANIHGYPVTQMTDAEWNERKAQGYAALKKALAR